jgi:HEAT repeat protein
MPHDIVVVLLVGSAITFLLILILPIQKSLAQRRWREHQRRTRRLESFMLEVITAEGDDIPEELPSGLRDPALLRNFVHDQLHHLKGFEKVRMRSILERSGFVEHYERLLGSRNPDRRAKAVEVLGDLGYVPLVANLTENLSTPKRELTTVSARALTKVVEDLRCLFGESWQEVFETALDNGSRLDTLVTDLVALLRGADRWTETVTLEALHSLGEPCHQKIIEALDDPEEDFRATCANACGRLSISSAVPKLTELLEDTSTNVRARACAALGALGDVRAAEKLISKTTEARWPVRAQALKALGLLGVEEHLPVVKSALKDSSWWVRTNAVEALANFGEKGIEVLFEVLHGDDHYARERAAQKLQHIGAIQKLIHRWLEKGEPTDRKTVIDFCRTGFFSSLLSRFQTRPGCQTQILELVLDVFRSFLADLESGVGRRMILSSRALKRMERDFFPEKARELEPKDDTLREGIDQMLDLYMRLQDLSKREASVQISPARLVDQVTSSGKDRRSEGRT